MYSNDVQLLSNLKIEKMVIGRKEKKEGLMKFHFLSNAAIKFAKTSGPLVYVLYSSLVENIGLVI